MKTPWDQVVTAHEQGDSLVLNYTQDVEPILDIAARERRVDHEERSDFGRRGEFRRTMTVPITIIMAVGKRLGIPAGELFDSAQSKRIMRELKGPEFKLFRTVNDRNI